MNAPPFQRFFLCLIAALSWLQASPAFAQKLTWSSPPLQEPTRVSLHQSASGEIEVQTSRFPYDQPSTRTAPADQQLQIKLKPNEDADVILPDQTLRLKELRIDYGRRVQLIGGRLEALAPADNKTRALLRFGGTSQSVYVQDVVLDCNRQYGLDGLLVGSYLHQKPIPAPDIYVQNSAIVNVFGGKEGLHADGFQFYGRTGWTRMDRVSVIAQYQGLFLDPQADIEGIDLRRIDLSYLHPSTGSGYLFFLRTHPDGRRPPVKLQDIYVGERTNHRGWEKFSVFPSSEVRFGARRQSDRITFPSFPEVEGHITKGRPPGGHWATVLKPRGNIPRLATQRR